MGKEKKPEQNINKNQESSACSESKSLSPEPPKEKVAETRHELKIGGKTLHYQAYAGTLNIKDEDKVKASMYYTAYMKTPTKNTSERPITFAFNGGPGSSSVWLHIGAFGPKKVALQREGWSLPPPGRTVDNPYHLLDVTDLVFIDPISTGFSRAFPIEDGSKYHTVKEDMLIMADFIQTFLTRYQRWGSPKYIAGESYGGTRAAYLAHHLETNAGIALNGLIFISPALNFQTIQSGRDSNQLSYACFLPSYTATAWYHKKLQGKAQKSLENTLKECERFVTETYIPFLMKGNQTTATEKQLVTDRLHQFTGLSKSYIEHCHYRISDHRFPKELLRDQFQTVGRFDSRCKGKDRDSGGEHIEYDPSYATIQGAYTSAWNDYLHHELKYSSDLPYHILTDIYKSWSWIDNNKETGRYIDFSDEIRLTLNYNPFIKVFIAHGYYDLATPYYSSFYTAMHIGFDDSHSKRITCKNYPAGHMMYTNEDCHRGLKNDLLKFFNKNSN